jgi:hypothetical protein
MRFNKSGCILLLILISVVAFSQISSAQPPLQRTVIIAQGIQIESPIIEFHQANTTFDFHIHAHNGTDGILLTNVTTNCTIHIYDPITGEHIFQSLMGFSSNLFDFDIEVNAGNFTQLGQYAVLFYCEVPGEIGGFLEHSFTVTNITTTIGTPESIMYFLLTIAVFSMFVFSVWGAIGLPGRNRRNELNRVIGVEVWKYPKIGLMFLSYAFFTWLINIFLIISTNLVELTQFEAFFAMIFNILMAGLYAVFIFMIVVFFILGARDLKLRDLLTRGIQPK